MSQFLLKSEDETRALAGQVLAHLRAGDCLLLEGPVGAGKSFFTRALIQGQMEADGHVEDVPSPTFTLVQMYETSRGEIWHADLYRLGSADELEELGLAEALSQAICVIEWPERLGAMTPERHLKIALSFPDESDVRAVEFVPKGLGWDWLDGLVSSLPSAKECSA